MLDHSHDFTVEVTVGYLQQINWDFVPFPITIRGNYI
jgi:hypothetical protein